MCSVTPDKSHGVRYANRMMVRTASQMFRPYGPRPAVRALLSHEGPESANTDRFPVSSPHY